MLRVRPGGLLVRASFAPSSELITLDFPTLERPRKAISGTPGGGKCVKSLADSINRARIRIQTVSSVWVADGKRRRKNKFARKLRKNWRFVSSASYPVLRIQCFVPSALYQGIALAMPKSPPGIDAPL